ncbi:hypothetical protein C7B89_19595 [Lysinibacillus capsici]|nr:hypothetical protein C7B89_19595 [Lysinibacillus capsici]
MVERFGLNKGELNDIKKMAIPEQIAEINKMLNKMGITQETVNAMGETTLGYWAQIQERVGKFLRQVGNLGNSKLGETLGKIVEAFDNIDLDGMAKKLDAKLAGLVDNAIAFGKFVWKWREPIAYIAGALTAAMGAFAIVGVIAALANPVTLIAAGIAAAAVGFKALYDNSKVFRGFINGIRNAVKTVSRIFESMFILIKGGFKDYGKGRKILENLGLEEKQIKTVIRFAYGIKGAFDKVKAVFKSISFIFSGQHKASIDILKSVGFSDEKITSIRKFGNSLKSAFDTVGNIFGGVGSILSGEGSADLIATLGLSPEVASVVDSVINKITSKIKSLWKAFKMNGVSGLVDAIYGKGTFEAIKTKFEEVKAYIAEKVTQFKGVFDRLKEAFSKAWTTISDIISNVWSIIEPYLSGFWNILQVIGDIAMKVFDNIIAPAISFLVQLFSTLWSIAKPVLELLGIAWEALSAIIKWAWDNVLAPLVDFILTGVKNALEGFSGALSIVQGWFETLSGWISTAKGHVKDFIDSISNVKLPGWITKGISAGINFAGNFIGVGNGKGESPKSNYHGLDYVPYDGYCIAA